MSLGKSQNIRLVTVNLRSSKCLLHNYWAFLTANHPRVWGSDLYNGNIMENLNLNYWFIGKSPNLPTLM